MKWMYGDTSILSLLEQNNILSAQRDSGGANSSHARHTYRSMSNQFIIIAYVEDTFLRLLLNVSAISEEPVSPCTNNNNECW